MLLGERDLRQDHTDLHQISIGVISLQDLYIFDGKARSLEVIEKEIEIADETHGLKEHLLYHLLIIGHLVDLHEQRGSLLSIGLHPTY